jgi:predicted RNase H-like HicB family nuclease
VKIEFTSRIFKEGRMFVAHTPELDISSCATTKTKALENLREAVRLFLEEAERRGSLQQILKEAGFSQRNRTMVGPKLVDSKRVSMVLPLSHAQT